MHASIIGCKLPYQVRGSSGRTAIDVKAQHPHRFAKWHRAELVQHHELGVLSKRHAAYAEELY